jgi:hypothetical protein
MMDKRRKGDGRPKKAIIQEKFIGYFVTHAQNFVIQAKAKEAGVSISDYMRQMAIQGYVKTRLTPEDRELFKGLVAMSNDIHWLVKQAEKEGAGAILLYFSKYGSQIDELINRFSHDQ